MEEEIKFQEISKAKYDCLLFDLDDTLYPLSSGMSALVAKNIEEYMLEKLGIEAAKVPELNHALYKIYGTTMAGLRAIGYDFDYDEFHSHAVRALKSLGFENCFERIVSFDTLNSFKDDDKDGRESTQEIFDFYEHLQPLSDVRLPRTPIVCKPFEDAFEKVFILANIDPQRTLFFDDSIRNLVTAKRLGLHTVMVGTSICTTGVDHALESIHNIREALPELWNTNGKHEIVKYKVAIETSVKA